jgi:hypothetical protein
MRTVIVRIGATGAGALLALGLLAGPSAAKDSDQKSTAEKARESNKVTCFQPDGETNTQGRSLSDPDGDTNGGADKPGCTGGVDATDRDGNNGCGNDADREDDNNGNCGGDRAAADEPAQPEDGDDVTVNPETVEGDVNVQSAASESGTPATEASSTAPADSAAVTAADNTTPAADSTTPGPETQVLGETLTAPDTLPRTGAAVGGLALLGGLLVGGGRLTVLARKLLRIG